MNPHTGVSPVDEVVDLPDVLVVWGSPAALAGVIELDPHSPVMVATRHGKHSPRPGERLVTEAADEALEFLRSRHRTVTRR